MDELASNVWLQAGFAGFGYLAAFILWRQLIKVMDAMNEQQRKMAKVLTLIAERVRIIGVKIGHPDQDIAVDP